MHREKCGAVGFALKGIGDLCAFLLEVAKGRNVGEGCSTLCPIGSGGRAVLLFGIWVKHPQALPSQLLFHFSPWWNVVLADVGCEGRI